MKQLTAKTAKELKQKLFDEQDGMCPLSGLKLESVGEAHLDHDHALEGINAGKVRGLLSRGANNFEGYVKLYFMRTGLQSSGVELSCLLRNLADYLEMDYSGNDFHPNYVPDMIKRFKRLSLTEMRDEMQQRGFEFEQSDTKAEISKKFAKQFRLEQKKL